MSASLKPHGINVGLLVGAVVAVSAILLLVVAGTVRYLLKRKAGLRSTSAQLRFSMFNPSAKQAAPPAGRADVAWQKPDVCEEEKQDNGQFVLISTSAEDVRPEHGERLPEEETPPLEVLNRISSVFNDDDIVIRRHSSPAVFTGEDPREEMIEEFLKSRPLSLPHLQHDSTRRIQRQKAAELAQMMRMQIIHTDGIPSPTSASSSRTSFASEKPRSVVNGLGIVHEADEQEVDIGSTAMAALEEYEVAIGSVGTPVRISEMFQVNKDGRIVRLSLNSTSNLTSPVTPLSAESEVMPKTPAAETGSDDDSTHTGDSLEEDLNSAVVVSMTHSKSVSMTFKRPILISVQTSKSMTISPPASHPAELRLSCPPMARPVSAAITSARSPSPSSASPVHSAAASPSGSTTGLATHASHSGSTISAFP